MLLLIGDDCDGGSEREIQALDRWLPKPDQGADETLPKPSPSASLTPSNCQRVQMDAILGSVPMQRLVDSLALLRARFDTPYDWARTVLFFYVVLKYGVKSLRHLKARGTLETFRDGWGWLSEVRSLEYFALR